MKNLWNPVQSPAKWIWLDYVSPWGTPIKDYHQEKIVGVLPSEKNRWGLFRKTFVLPSSFTPGEQPAILKISADSRYKLFINGNYIGRGIYRCNRFVWYYDEYDVSKSLHPGQNVIGVIVQFFGDAMSWYEEFPHGPYWDCSLGKGGLIFELKIPAGRELQTIFSDASVRGMPCDAWDQKAPRVNIGLPFVEIFDSRLYDLHWLEIKYDDSDQKRWGHTRELVLNNFTPTMVPCDIPRLTETPHSAKKLASAGEIAPFLSDEELREILSEGVDEMDFFIILGKSDYWNVWADFARRWDGKFPLKIEMHDRPVGLVFDMGQVCSGFIFFEVETDAADTILELAWAEILDPGRGNLFPRLSPYRTKSGMQFRCVKGNNRYETFHWHGLRYIQLNVKGSPAKISVKQVGVTQYLYPVEPRGQFQCSDPRIAAVYDACRWTLRNCMHDGFEDCPSREQRQWIGDAYVEIMSNYALFGDTALTKKLIRQVAQSQRGDGLTEMCTPGDHHIHGLIIPDYAFYWIGIVFQFYHYTGDKEIVSEVFPSMIKAVKWFIAQINPQTGLLTDMLQWAFIDWSANDKWGANCVLNAQLYNGLNQIIFMGKIIGWDMCVEEFRPIADKIARGINQFLWDENRQAYIDAVVVDQTGQIVKRSKKVTFHSNSLVLLYDIAPKDRLPKVFASVFDQPYEKIFVQNRKPIWEKLTPAKLDEDAHVVMAEPFFMHHVHQMFAKYGRYDQIIRYLRDGWARMLDLGATTIWETWGTFGSLCHAWCTTPAYDLATHCLGVILTKTAGTEVKVTPHFMGMAWAEGVVPLAQGDLRVRWEWNEKSQLLTVYCNPPKSTAVLIEPPIVNSKSPRSSSLFKSTKWSIGNTYQY